MKKSMFGIFLVGVILFLGFDRSNEKPVAGQQSKRLSVVATAFYQYDLARQVLGREENCTLIVPPGRSAIEYIPTKNDEKKIEEADIFIYNGDEPWAGKLIENHPEINGIRMLDYVKESWHTNCGSECICISPGNAKKLLGVIAGEIKKKDTANSVFYDANTKNYIAQLNALNPECALYSCCVVEQNAFLAGETYVSLLSGHKKQEFLP